MRELNSNTEDQNQALRELIDELRRLHAVETGTGPRLRVIQGGGAYGGGATPSGGAFAGGATPGGGGTGLRLIPGGGGATPSSGASAYGGGVTPSGAGLDTGTQTGA